MINYEHSPEKEILSSIKYNFIKNEKKKKKKQM